MSQMSPPPTPPPTPPPGAAPIEALLAHREWVRALARSLVRDESSADDVVQQTWQAALQNPPAKLSAARAWLGSVVRRTVRDSQRRHVRRERRELSAARPEGLPATADVVARVEIDRAVVNSVAELPEPYRTTLLLRFYDGLPPRDVAARMGVPVETVRARTRRALERVRGGLDARHGGERGVWKAALVPFLAGPGGPATADIAPDTPATGGTAAGTASGPLAPLVTTFAAALGSFVLGVVGARLMNTDATDAAGRGAAAPTHEALVTAERAVDADRKHLARTRARINDVRASADDLEHQLAQVRRAVLAASASAPQPDSSDDVERVPFERPVRFPAFDAALSSVDWDDLGEHIARMVLLLGEIHRDVNAGRALRPAAIGEVQAHNGALLSVVGPLDESFPGGAANTALTHPAFMATLVAAVCHARDLPLSAEQITALDRAAKDASLAVARTVDETREFRLAAVIDETRAKLEFTNALRTLLTPEQRALLGDDATRGVVGYDLFGPGPVWVTSLETGRFSSGDDLSMRIATGIGRELELDTQQQNALNGIVAEWVNTLPDEYLGRASSPVEERDEAHHLEVVLTAAQYMLDLMRRVSELDLTADQRASIRNSREVMVLRRTD